MRVVGRLREGYVGVIGKVNTLEKCSPIVRCLKITHLRIAAQLVRLLEINTSSNSTGANYELRVIHVSTHI